MDKVNLKVETVFDSIYRKSRSHYLAQLHATMGFNNEDLLSDIIQRYEKETVPSILELSDEDKKELLAKLRKMVASNLPGYTKDFFTISIEYINNALNPKEEVKEEELVPQELNPNEEELVNNCFNSLCEWNQNYCEARYHSTFGINMGDVLDDMVNTYQDELLPTINELSVPAKTTLQAKIKDKINNLKSEDKMDSNILERFIADIENSKESHINK